MESQLFKVFTQDPKHGNSAAVILAEELSEKEMQSLATQINTVITVFVLPSHLADARFRFFSISSELPFCGHGILAAADYYMKVTGHQQIKVETQASVVTISRNSKGTIHFETTGVSIIDCSFDQKEVLSFLGINEDLIHKDLPFCIASIGSPKLFVPIKKLVTVQSITPDFEAISEWSSKMKVNGVYVYTFETQHSDSSLHARSFNPLFGVKEDAATGVAAGALAGVLVQAGYFHSTLIVEQGYNLGQESKIFVEVGDVIKLGGFVTQIGKVEV
ncbi:MULTISPECIES: PhzF family phenazine biosynthesis protein [Aneurinibacillus]|uniref:Phenazine biosynthesis protein PhzF family n=1 Tax=Aneurinibacillus thermoaerophilus TaxID=143495 RepID=A0A1G8F3B2_ANETH|nr:MULTISPECIES: PhzF family phenazine biosynthesis protein [Aneurinibacillus]AMA73430.1 hypothetical protein ACH33_11570 [Aneurinibacillus sp. XH2]MED0677650.1 PhzF family phenazine biosynthesis protein [Aneurinibacillus thermoaerophilus]MED0738643.1 PhzF family phenazine biosynthesis protein [Aneurinibacillus thermoaerophilus]MED0758916.1 PhzF family phenazine biosynthesis protein [Aneurinibacillus thermoaerophilus]MED0760630.1 PhzF family phenazine biosynthesis protein [Aneurinibacillus the